MRLFSGGVEFRRRFIVLKINIVRKRNGQELRERGFWPFFFYQEGRVADKVFSATLVVGVGGAILDDL